MAETLARLHDYLNDIEKAVRGIRDLDGISKRVLNEEIGAVLNRVFAPVRAAVDFEPIAAVASPDPVRVRLGSAVACEIRRRLLAREWASPSPGDGYAAIAEEYGLLTDSLLQLLTFETYAGCCPEHAALERSMREYEQARHERRKRKTEQNVRHCTRQRNIQIGYSLHANWGRKSARPKRRGRQAVSSG